MMKYKFSRPSFLEGIARLFDVRGSLNHHEFLDDPQAGIKALASDWAAVGIDMQHAIEEFEEGEKCQS